MNNFDIVKLDANIAVSIDVSVTFLIFYLSKYPSCMCKIFHNILYISAIYISIYYIKSINLDIILEKM